MTHDHDLAQPGVLDVDDDRVNPVGDRQRPKVTRLASPTRKVNRKHPQLRFQAVDLADGEIPAVGSMGATVDED
jgi:hypothetical protein